MGGIRPFLRPFHPFTTACELDRIAVELWPRVDVLVATAAVCDYRPAEPISGKRKKSADPWELRLVANPDVLAARGAEKEDERGPRVLVGFALETERGEEEARRKAVNKCLDLVLCNTPDNLGVAMGDYVWLEPGESAISMPDITKRDLAIKDYKDVLKMDSYYPEVAEARERIQEIGDRR